MDVQKDFFHYLPVSDSAMRWGIYVNGAGLASIGLGEEYPPKGHPDLYQFQWWRGRTLPEFQALLITDGRGVFESKATGEVALESGSVFFLFPGVWHRYRPDPATGWTERWISLHGEIIHRLMDQGLIDPDNAVRLAKSPDGLVAGFDNILSRIHANPTQNTILLSMHAMALLADMIEQSTGAGPVGNEQLSPDVEYSEDSVIAQTLDLIWTHSHRPLSVAQLAKKLPVTRRTLERQFVAKRGHSVLDEINMCRLVRAKRLLAETDLPIKTVAYLAGFSSPETMRITFVRRENMSPSQYRDNQV